MASQYPVATPVISAGGTSGSDAVVRQLRRMSDQLAALMWIGIACCVLLLPCGLTAGYFGFRAWQLEQQVRQTTEEMRHKLNSLDFPKPGERPWHLPRSDAESV